MTRQYWEKRLTQRKRQNIDWNRALANIWMVLQWVVVVGLLLHQIIKLNLLKRQDLTERNAGGCQQKYTIRALGKFFPRNVCHAARFSVVSFHQMPFYGHDIYPFFRKKCDHKMVANLRWLLLSKDFASRGFWTLGGVTTQLRACRIRSGTPPVETNLHFQSFSGYVVFVCLSLPKRMGI